LGSGFEQGVGGLGGALPVFSSSHTGAPASRKGKAVWARFPWHAHTLAAPRRVSAVVRPRRRACARLAQTSERLRRPPGAGSQPLDNRVYRGPSSPQLTAAWHARGCCFRKRCLPKDRRRIGSEPGSCLGQGKCMQNPRQKAVKLWPRTPAPRGMRFKGLSTAP
jgi:hypothetical protein